MAIAVAQEVQGQDPNFGTNGTTIAATITVAAGSWLHVLAFANGSSGMTASVSDGTNTYTVIGDVFQSGHAYHWYAGPVAGGTYTITITFSATVNLKGVVVRELTGASGYQTHIEAGPVSPGTGTDALTSGSMTPSSQPAMVSALAMDTFFGATAAAGTGFTSTTGGALIGKCWDFGDGAANSYARMESKRVTSTSAVAATFTTTAGTDKFCVLAAIFTEASGVSVALTGLSATASGGTMVPAWSKALTGAAATGAGGTSAPAVAPPLTGAAATIARGTPVPAVAAPLSGLAASSAGGTVTPPGAGGAALTGQSVTVSGGVMTPAIGVPLAGLAATSAGGTASPAVSPPLVGRAASSAGGALSPAVAAQLTGAAVAAAAGTLTPPAPPVSLAITMPIPYTVRMT